MTSLTVHTEGEAHDTKIVAKVRVAIVAPADGGERQIGLDIDASVTRPARQSRERTQAIMSLGQARVLHDALGKMIGC